MRKGILISMGRTALFIQIFFLIFVRSHAHAMSVQEVKSFATEAYHNHFWGENVLAWTATGGPPLLAREDCSDKTLEQNLTATRSLIDQQRYLSAYFLRCGTELNKKAYNRYYALIGGVNFHYNYEQSRLLRDLIFTDSAGQKIRGQLFLKPGTTPRPLVIFKCGLQSDLGSAESREAAALISDGMPFHLLILPSVTGLDYEMDNHVLAVGGYDEGQQIIDVAHFLRGPTSPYAQNISSIHVMGVSLGGHAALYSSLFASNEKASPIIQSVVALSPVVDLEPSVKGLYGGGPLANYFFSSFSEAFFNLLDVIPTFLQLLPQNAQKLTIQDIPALIARGGLTYYRDRSKDPAWRRAPFQHFEMKSENDFWNLNRFQNEADLVRVPTLVWASEDDVVVHAAVNARVLAGSLSSAGKEHLQVLITPRGSHVDFWEAYGWSTTSTVLKNFFLQHAPEFLNRRRILMNRIDTSSEVFPTDSKRQTIAWRVVPHARDLEIVDTFLMRNDLHCAGHAACLPFEHSLILHVPPEILGLDAHWLPVTESQGEAWTRFLNANYDILNENGQSMGLHDRAGIIRWSDYSVR